MCLFWEFYATNKFSLWAQYGVLNDKARDTNNNHCAGWVWYAAQTLWPRQLTLQCTAHFIRLNYLCAWPEGGNKSRFLSHIMLSHNIRWDVLLLSAFVKQLKVGSDDGLQRPVWLYIIKCGVCVSACSSHDSEVIEISAWDFVSSSEIIMG